MPSGCMPKDASDALSITIDGREIRVPRGVTILEAARLAGIYIPVLCSHPDLPPAKGSAAVRAVYQAGRKIENARAGETAPECGICLVEIHGLNDLVMSCSTAAEDGMVVMTDTDRVRDGRRNNLIPILARHPHACLTCTQRDGCSRDQCSSHVPESERCCPRFGHCELQDVAEYVGIPDSTPGWAPTSLPVVDDDPLFIQDANLCIGCTRCVRACRDLRGVEAIGFVRDPEGRVRIGTLEPTLEDSGCRFCMACVEVCPTGALMDRNIRTGHREQDLVPCREACPVHLDVPEYIRLIAQGRTHEALAVIRERIPFPGVLGRVCTRPCEEVCRRGELNEPVAICDLKRYAADAGRGRGEQGLQPAGATGKQVAVIGAGPAGLTVAFYLRKAGHRVILYEEREMVGGMMRYGIPAYRLPRDVLDREIQDILDLEVDIRPGMALGRDFHVNDLLTNGFDAVFIGIGAQEGRRLSIEGADLPEVLRGVDFLRRINWGDPLEVTGEVVVIGGGNVAVDAALAALRRGADRVTVACLENREAMPAHERDVEGMLAEGVRLISERGPRRFMSREGRLCGVELVRCTGLWDEKGAFSPVFDPGVVERVKADRVILAVGQSVDSSFLQETEGIGVDHGRIDVNRNTQETGVPGVYAGGDATVVRGSIIHAVAAARRAASSMDRALGGSGNLDEVLVSRRTPSPHLGREEGFADRLREEIPRLDPSVRAGILDELSVGYDDPAARREASRCLRCDLRLFMARNPSPPGKWLPFTEESVTRVPDAGGVYRLMDEERNVLAIRGTADLRASLLEELNENERAVLFDFEEEPMYSRLESEWIRRHLQEHGRMPGDEDDDLF